MRGKPRTLERGILKVKGRMRGGRKKGRWEIARVRKEFYMVLSYVNARSIDVTMMSFD